MFCGKPISSKSKFAKFTNHKCWNLKDHLGKCNEWHFLKNLKTQHSKIAEKIKRDSIHTTGASWSGKNAGPNRILRWVVQLSDEQLDELGFRFTSLSPSLQKKLRDKSADYDTCMCVARKLTHIFYGTQGVYCPPDIQNSLELEFGSILPNQCVICGKAIQLDEFHDAIRGRAAIETSHLNPRFHSAENVGFAHRKCNIAQGEMTKCEFLNWISLILQNNDLKSFEPINIPLPTEWRDWAIK